MEPNDTERPVIVFDVIETLHSRWQYRGGLERVFRALRAL